MDAILARLEAHGSAFLEACGRNGGGGRRRDKNASASRRPAAAAAASAGSEDDEPSTSHASDGEVTPSTSSSSDDEAAADEVDALFAAAKQEKKTSAAAVPTRPTLVVAAVRAGGRHRGAGAAPTSLPPPVDLRAERKALMSGRVDVTAAARDGQNGNQRTHRRGRPPPPHPATPAGDDPDRMPSRAEFAAMRHEVEDFGVANLDKRARKAAETKKLAALGFAPEKGPRIPASIGYGMAAKRRACQASALEAAIDAGLVSRSGLGKKKRRAEERERKRARSGPGGGGRRGEVSLDPGVRHGVLHVREAPLKKKQGGGRRFNIDKIKL